MLLRAWLCANLPNVDFLPDNKDAIATYCEDIVAVLPRDKAQAALLQLPASVVLTHTKALVKHLALKGIPAPIQAVMQDLVDEFTGTVAELRDYAASTLA